MPHGVAVAVVQLVKIEPFTDHHLAAACIETMPEEPGYAWNLTNAREVKPFLITGKQRLFDVAALPVLIDDESEEDHYDLFLKMARFG